MRIQFHKMHGAGNDFVVLDARLLPFDWPTPERLGRIGVRRLGIGCEGIVLLLRSASADFRKRFFNPDGSEAAFCGNGARCIARFAHAIGVAPVSMQFETMAGRVEATLVDEGVHVVMPPCGDVSAPMTFSLDQTRLKGYALCAGVPHLVVPVADVRRVDVRDWGKRLRNHPAFAPEGTNVDFVSPLETGPGPVWRLRTYERGVEAESGACGSGAVASGLALMAHGGVLGSIQFLTRDGFVLGVERAGNGCPVLTGPATTVYRGEITIAP